MPVKLALVSLEDELDGKLSDVQTYDLQSMVQYLVDDALIPAAIRYCPTLAGEQAANVIKEAFLDAELEIASITPSRFLQPQHNIRDALRETGSTLSGLGDSGRKLVLSIGVPVAINQAVRELTGRPQLASQMFAQATIINSEHARDFYHLGNATALRNHVSRIILPVC